MDRESMLSQAVPQDGAYLLENGRIQFLPASGLAPDAREVSR
jgi:hypothetical protein